MATYYVLKAEKDGVEMRVEVNDVPVLVWNNQGKNSRTDQLNAWLERGEATVRVRLERRAEPGETAPAPASATLTVAPVVKDQPAGKPLLEFSWPPANKEQEQYPFEKSFPFKVEDPPPSEFWTAAKPVNLGPQEREGAIAVVAELQEALAARNRERALDLLLWKAIDMRRAHYLDVQDARDDLTEYLGFFLDSPDWEVAPLKRDQLEIHALAGNRLFWVTEPDSLDPIRSKEGASPTIRIPVYVAPLKGKWTIVR